ncbi:hypothetical protein L249_6584 [Ophiocordyceps polyrhachis-furcata BCC 54312]|uniref:Heme haloperoxidase family profile domain-containing protein n=1 Tax=Ophiocordyceps polyrhachis-furcata BCC 54312 TaxID=1330021 RepID=A0A367LJV1_9HYPO|nr:hypothetical protein L249_6584 [Ophiocordyceps polyrhachis-furcata BCC 54312]
MRLLAACLLTLSLYTASAEAWDWFGLFPENKPLMNKVQKAGLPADFVEAFEARQPKDQHMWQSPPQGAARGPCPALNTLANHGYLRRDGKNITLPEIIDAAFAAWLLLPDMTGLITARGIFNSKHDLGHKFNLSMPGHKSWKMEHDCSFSRLDKKEGDPIPFRQGVWISSLFDLFGTSAWKAISFQSTLITPQLLAKAKAARVQNIFRKCDYSGFAAAEGALEIGMTISALQENNSGGAKLSYVRGLFEKERIISDDDDKEVEKQFVVGGFTQTLKFAQDALQASRTLQRTTDVGEISTAADILRILKPSDPRLLVELRNIIVDDLLYPTTMVESLDELIRDSPPQPPPPPPPPPGFGPDGFGPPPPGFPAFGPPGFGRQGFGRQGFGPQQQGGFPQRGFPQRGFPQQGFSQQQPGFPQRGFPPQNSQQDGRRRRG